MLEILDFNLSHLSEVLKIETESFENPWTEKMFLDYPDKNTYFKVLTLNEKVLGYNVFQIVFNEAHILKIAVSQNYRRQGFASKLILDFLEFSKSLNANEVFLEVRANNINAIKFYESFNFTEIGRRPKYYGAKLDAIILRKQIQ
ncbi:MAG: ribosomal protein S18-alanine N-acetyltransferase [Elusimicrobiota bacterium]|jgi:ribosomal-protein-alanine N-acetyltransferase|nr:ribosomal protein S18-alanine N-acetyltransferase [Elusimicrobiota bacterium]